MWGGALNVLSNGHKVTTTIYNLLPAIIRREEYAYKVLDVSYMIQAFFP